MHNEAARLPANWLKLDPFRVVFFHSNRGISREWYERERERWGWDEFTRWQSVYR